MADQDFRYPLSTAEGTSIPLDVVRPHSLLSQSFLSSGGTASLDVPLDVEVMIVQASVNCIIQFAESNASATPLVDGVAQNDAMYVSGDIVTVISPPVGLRTFSIIGNTEDGVAIIQYLRKWTALALQSQFTRR